MMPPLQYWTREPRCGITPGVPVTNYLLHETVGRQLRFGLCESGVMHAECSGFNEVTGL
jgi:hypothetical protein